jgi:hypothetical protein
LIDPDRIQRLIPPDKLSDKITQKLEAFLPGTQNRSCAKNHGVEYFIQPFDAERCFHPMPVDGLSPQPDGPVFFKDHHVLRISPLKNIVLEDHIHHIGEETLPEIISDYPVVIESPSSGCEVKIVIKEPY